MYMYMVLKIHVKSFYKVAMMFIGGLVHTYFMIYTYLVHVSNFYV